MSFNPSLFSSQGIGSGLEVASMVEALSNYEISPQKAILDKQRNDLDVSVSSYGEVKSVLDSLRITTFAMDRFNDLTEKSVTSSDATSVTATATSSTNTGSHSIKVTALAQNQINVTTNSNFTSGSSVIGGGTLTIDVGTWDVGKTSFTSASSKSITVPDGSTLDNVADLINATSGSGVTASVVTGESNAYIVIQGSATGDAKGLRISVSGEESGYGTATDNDGLSSLAYDPPSAVTNAALSQDAQNSSAIINGATVSNTSNTITSLPGLTIELLKESATTTHTLEVKNDVDGLKDKIDTFVTAYNSAMEKINELDYYNSIDDKGPLFGDNMIRRLKSSLIKSTSVNVPGLTGDYLSLPSIGMDRNADNTISFNQTELDAAISADFEQVVSVFSKGGQASDSLVKAKSVGVNVTTGSYDINLSAYTPGVTLEGTIGGLSATSTDGIVLAGSSTLAGLSVEVLGGSTGDRGTVTVFEGVAFQLNELIKSYTSSSTGILSNIITNQNEQLEEVGVKEAKLEDRKEEIEARYLKQFGDLDVIVAQYNSTSDFLTGFFKGLTQDK